MAGLKKSCPYCLKPKTEIDHKDCGGFRVIKFDCGHSITEKLVSRGIEDRLLDGSIAYPFQMENLRKAEESGVRILIADEMGLGKTISTLLIFKNHPEILPAVIVCKSSLTEQWFQEIVRKLGLDFVPQIISDGREQPLIGVFRIFIVSYDLLRRVNWIEKLSGHIKTIVLDECQHIKNTGAARTQHVRELASGVVKRKRIYTPNLDQRKRIQVIAEDLMTYHGVKDRFKLSFENLGEKKLGLCECRVTKDGIIEGQITIHRPHAENDSESEVIETILHEISHAITPGAGHRNIWRETSLAIGGNGQAIAYCDGSEEFKENIEQSKYIIALSGTPIKNRAPEYFPVLNLIRPEIFPTYDGFIRQHCVQYVGMYGKASGPIRLRDPEYFKKLTDEFIIRHERKDVLPDLPPISRQYHYSDLGSQVEAEYILALKDFNKSFDESEGKQTIGEENILAKMARLRHITGKSKIQPCIDYITDYLENTDRKIVVFRHHDDIADKLKNELTSRNLEINHLTSQMNGKEKYDSLEQFRTDPKKRVLIASTLSAGEGLNMQFCSDCIILERQWNPANEEQAEGRFSRPWNNAWGPNPWNGSGRNKVNANYLVAIGTIDEFLAELVEKKRHMFRETMDGNKLEGTYDTQGLMKELAEILREKGGKRFGLK